MLQKKNIFSKNDFITVINLFDIKSKTLNNVDGVVNNIVYNGYKNGAVITRNAKQEEYVQTVKDNDICSTSTKMNKTNLYVEIPVFNLM